MDHSSPTFYVFHGSDEFTISETVNEFRDRLGPAETADLNTTWLDGRGVSLGELQHSCAAVPFLAENRLVIVTGLLTRLKQRKGDDELLEGLLELITGLPDSTRLVLVEHKSLSGNHPVIKLAKEGKRGFVREFEPPKEKGGGLQKWIIKRAERYDGRIAGSAAAHLAQSVGDNLRLLDQEIAKLVTYAGADAEITREDVDRVVPYVKEAVIFDLVDALGHRDGRTAASTLQRLIDDGQPSMAIMAMIIRQFRLLIQVKELSQSGENAASIARALKIHSFPAGKLYQQAINFSPEQLELVYRHLLATDVSIKTGELTPEVALDVLIAGLTEPPQ